MISYPAKNGYVRKVAGLAVALALMSSGLTVYLWLYTLSEGEQRRDQTCELFEKDHLKDVQRLRNTYRYLVDLTPRQKRDPLNQVVIRNLPETEAEARTDSAPDYCDDPGIGLPEPDPVVPERPESLK